MSYGDECGIVFFLLFRVVNVSMISLFAKKQVFEKFGLTTVF